jgi:hypothetical protein
MTKPTTQFTFGLEPHLGFGRTGVERREAGEITLERPKTILKLEDLYEGVGLS